MRYCLLRTRLNTRSTCCILNTLLRRGIQYSHTVVVILYQTKTVSVMD